MKDLVTSSKACPVCHSFAVARGQQSRYGAPTFQCTACRSELRSKLTFKALWALPAEVVMLAAIYIAFTWFRGSSFSSPTLNAAVLGGLVALSIGISGRIALRALTFARA